MAFVYRLFHVVVKGLGIDRVIQLFEINLFTPELPKTPCEESSNFYVRVLLVMSSVSQTIWHLVAQG